MDDARDLLPLARDILHGENRGHVRSSKNHQARRGRPDHNHSSGHRGRGRGGLGFDGDNSRSNGARATGNPRSGFSPFQTLSRYDRLRAKCTLILDPTSPSAFQTLRTAPKWEDVCEVVLGGAGEACPVCLERPGGGNGDATHDDTASSAGRAVITPCGHVYCLLCWLQCASAVAPDVRGGERGWERGDVDRLGVDGIRLDGTAVVCPLCSEFVIASDVKPVSYGREQPDSVCETEVAALLALGRPRASAAGDSAATMDGGTCRQLNSSVGPQLELTRACMHEYWHPSTPSPLSSTAQMYMMEPAMGAFQHSTCIGKSGQRCAFRLIATSEDCPVVNHHHAHKYVDANAPLGAAWPPSLDARMPLTPDLDSPPLFLDSTSPPPFLSTATCFTHAVVSNGAREADTCRTMLASFDVQQAGLDREVRAAAEQAAAIITAILDAPRVPQSPVLDGGSGVPNGAAGAWSNKRSVSTLMRSLSTGSSGEEASNHFSGSPDLASPANVLKHWKEGYTIPPGLPAVWLVDAIPKIEQLRHLALNANTAFRLLDWAKMIYNNRAQACRRWEAQVAALHAGMALPSASGGLVRTVGFTSIFGQNVYLHPLTMHAVMTALVAQGSNAASRHPGALVMPSYVFGDITQVDCLSVSPETHKSQPFLRHLPLGAHAGFAELDTRTLVFGYCHSSLVLQPCPLSRAELTAAGLWAPTMARKAARDAAIAAAAVATTLEKSERCRTGSDKKTNAELLREYMGITDFRPEAFDTGAVGSSMSVTGARMAFEQYLHTSVSGARGSAVLADVSHFPALPSSPLLKATPSTGDPAPLLAIPPATASTSTSIMDKGDKWTFRKVTAESGYYPSLAEATGRPPIQAQPKPKGPIAGAAIASRPTGTAASRVTVKDVSEEPEMTEKVAPAHTLDLMAYLSKPAQGKQGAGTGRRR
jgi:hypothetical protein